MSLQPATRRILAVVLVVAAAIILLFIWNPITKSPSPDISQPSSTGTQGQIKRSLFLADGPESSMLSLDSEGEHVTAITLRFQLDQQSAAAPLSFELDPALTAAGWQVALQTLSPESMSYDIALLTTNPSGGMVFNQDTSIGTLKNANGMLRALDPAVSMAVSEDGAGRTLELVHVPAR